MRLTLPNAASTIGSGGFDYFATEGYIVTTAEGTLPLPAGTYVPGRLRYSGFTQRSMHGGYLRGGIPLSTGAFVLDNADGALDYLQQLYLDGRRYYLRVGTNDRNGPIEQAVAAGEDQIVVSVRDAAHWLDVPVLQNRYQGNNSLPAGLEGTNNDIGGQPKPMWIGTCRNVSPPCVNTARLIYQVDGHGGLRTGWSMTVYDAREELVAGANYSSQSDMESTAPTAGQVRWWPAGGMFRLGADPAGAVTVDGTNPNDQTLDATVTGIMKHLFFLSQNVGPKLYFAYLHADPETGIYVQEDRTILSVVNEVLANVSATLAGAPGPHTFGLPSSSWWSTQVSDPSDLAYTAATLQCNESNIVPGSLRQIVPPDDFRGLPIRRVNLQYSRNHTVMSAADLAGVDVATQRDLAQEYRTVTVTDDFSVFESAGEINVTTNLAQRADAEAEAQRILDLYKVPRRMFQYAVYAAAVRLVDGKADIAVRAHLTYPRFELDDGADFLIIGADQDYESDTYTLTVWG